MSERICSVSDCDRPTGKPHGGSGRGWCSKHYQRWQHHGSPLWTPPTLIEKIWLSIEAIPNGCWICTKKPGVYGYVQLYLGKDKPLQQAHRWVYEQLVGPIPEGMTLDHLCHNRDASCNAGPDCLHRRCVNPAHLEPVSIRTNVFRGRTPARQNAEKTHCVHGHALVGYNLVIDKRGKRSCRKCRQHADLAAYHRNKRLKK